MTNRLSEADSPLTEEETQLVAAIEELVDGKLISLEKQIRWRPAWYAKVEKHGGTVEIYVRGDRQSDILPFPELKREADILQVLEKNGVPVPHVYGMCQNPSAIIMEAVPGSRDIGTASSDDERRSVARQHMEALAAMHRIPLQEFADIGLEIPEGAEAIALAAFNAYSRLYQRIKPEPLIEFASKWLKANIPEHRTTASFVAVDAGQFLFEKGKLTALFDFEFGLVGDAAVDLATIAGRDSYEPMGDSIPSMLAHYAEITGEPLDPDVIRYQHAAFQTSTLMQFSGCLNDPKPGDPHDVYMEWDTGLRRTLIFALAACMHVELETPPELDPVQHRPDPGYKMISDLIDHIETGTEEGNQQKAAAKRFIEYREATDTYKDAIEDANRADIQRLLGLQLEAQDDYEQHLEDFILSATPDMDTLILQLLSNQIERKVQATGNTSIGQYGASVKLEPLI